jgi:glycosyltransferase involved in cell wall biosynthesis
MSMRTYVTLPLGVSADDWRDRHFRDEVPDLSPWGLHRIGDHGVEVTFSDRTLGRVAGRLARAVKHRAGGIEAIETARDIRALSAGNTDVVFSYHERTGFPACLAHTVRWSAPVVTGVCWLTSPEDTPPVVAVLARHALPRASAVFAQSTAAVTALNKHWGVPAEKLHYVPVGIDTDFYAVQPPPEVPDLVVSLGEDPFRDHDFLVAAVKMVRAKRPTTRLELATQLDVDVPAELGIVHRGRLHGRARELYQRACVVAVALKPNVHGSGLTVTLEAMASGRAVVVTKTPCMPAYIEDGVDGVLVPEGDLDAFAHAVEELLADPERASEIGRAAAARVRRENTSGVMAAQFARILRTVR